MKESRPGVLFSDCNATRREAQVGKSPDIVRFDVLQAKSYFDVPELLRKHFLAEVLVPSPIPPHLISFPEIPLQPAINPPLPLKMTSPTPSQPTTVGVAPATPHPVDGKSPPIARFSPCRAPDGMIASPSASLVHRKYVFQGDVICECGETGCVIATGFQLPKPSPPPKVERVSFSPVTSLGKLEFAWLLKFFVAASTGSSF